MFSIGSFPFTPCVIIRHSVDIFDSVNRASQKQEFRSQRASEPTSLSIPELSAFQNLFKTSFKL